MLLEAAVSPITTWQNFNVIIGSSAGALTGLMFVVITSIKGRHHRVEAPGQRKRPHRSSSTPLSLQQSLVEGILADV